MFRCGCHGHCSGGSSRDKLGVEGKWVCHPSTPAVGTGSNEHLLCWAHPRSQGMSVQAPSSHGNHGAVSAWKGNSPCPCYSPRCAGSSSWEKSSARGRAPCQECWLTRPSPQSPTAGPSQEPELGHVPALAADTQPQGSDVSLTLCVSPRGRYSPRADREPEPTGAQTTAHVAWQRSPRSPRSAPAGSLWFPPGTVPRHIPAGPPSHPHPDCSSQGCRGCSFGLAGTGLGSSRPPACPSDAHARSAPSPTATGCRR